ncbi:MAG: YdcF family protein [Ancrocorticia populi]|uniref:YdcF family protein n=1 Tax=Ancrocorticia populi TaxID=2175228 RepID=UPI003F904F3C
MGKILLVVAALLIIGGILGFIVDRRRLRNVVFVLFGLGIGLIGLLLYNDDGRGVSGPLAIVLLIMVIGPIIGYPILTVFLLANGVMMILRERRSLGNLLSLFLGIVLAGLPIASVVAVNKLDNKAGGMVLTGIFGIAVYFGFCFLVVLLASFAYRRIPMTLRGKYVIVLGSGLKGDKVPPLLAARLDMAMAVANQQEPPATIIPSGGKGTDEQISEAEGMARYLHNHGIDESRILLEDQARTTQENLINSRALLPAPDAHVIVATNSYHVFRAAMLTRQLKMDAQVVGSKTAAYYVPSAFLREFAAMMVQFAGPNMVMLSAWTAMVVSVLVIL